MTEMIEIEKDKLVEILWGICLSDNLGDVMDSIKPLVKALDINSNDACGQDALLDTLKYLPIRDFLKNNSYIIPNNGRKG